MFGFGKRKKSQLEDNENDRSPSPLQSHAEPLLVDTEQLVSDAGDGSVVPGSSPVHRHVGAEGDETHRLPHSSSRAYGPFDELDGTTQELLDPGNDEVGIADFGAYAFVAPYDADLQIEMNEAGQASVHILVGGGHLTMDAYAAPKSGGQWRATASEIADGLRAQGAKVSIVDGPWGREVVGHAPDSVIRFIGVDGPRWMLRMVVVSAPDAADSIAESARDIMRHTIVRRGTGAMPVGNPIPLVLPRDVQLQMQAVQQQVAAQQMEQAQRIREQQNNPAADSALEQLDGLAD